ncbi:Dam Site-specific DNA methylase [Candidatus Nanopelagicaceae bacterium]
MIEGSGSYKLEGKLPKPFLRWAGGKRRIAKMLLENFPATYHSSNGRYFEPFLGGGAVAFASGDPSSPSYIPGHKLILNDSNEELVNTYTVVRDQVYDLMEILDDLSEKVDAENYYEIRSSKPDNLVVRAARFIYLNKTCYNGLWRVNSKGEFNVPFDKSSSGNFYDEENLIACSERLEGSLITHGSYRKALGKVKEGDFVYLDPPYIPLSATESFASYAKEGFTLEDHRALAVAIEEIDKIGAHVLLSNSDTLHTREIFGQKLTLREIQMSRTIGSNPNSRKPVGEILGMNYDHPVGGSMSALTLIERKDQI